MGRKPKTRKEGLLTRAYAILDDAQIPAIKAVVTLMKSNHKGVNWANVRLKAAKIILDKRIPDLTDSPITQKPTQITVVHNYRNSPVTVNKRD